MVHNCILPTSLPPGNAHRIQLKPSRPPSLPTTHVHACDRGSAWVICHDTRGRNQGLVHAFRWKRVILVKRTRYTIIHTNQHAYAARDRQPTIRDSHRSEFISARDHQAEGSSRAPQATFLRTPSSYLLFTSYLYPFQDTALLVQTDHRVRSEPELPSPARGILLQQAVDHPVELHQPGILPEVPVAFLPFPRGPDISFQSGDPSVPHHDRRLAMRDPRLIVKCFEP